MKTQVVLGLGSNQGQPIGHLRRAIRALRGTDSPFKVLGISKIYKSDALLPENAPADWNRPYLNLACLAETSADPRIQLAWAKGLEKKLGRQNRGRWAPREIDIDLLASSAGPYQDGTLTLPHPGLLERPFALLPFADIAPKWQMGKITAQEISGRWRFLPSEEIPFRTRRSTQVLTELVGTLNVTPDSFSDGGRFLAVDQAIKHARHLISSGASVLDIGAESTRPGATTITPDEEWARLEPVLSALTQDSDLRANFTLSVDSKNLSTVRKALKLGVDWINDVSGGTNPELIRAVVDSPTSFVFMHSLSVPPRKDLILETSRDPITQLIEWGHRKTADFGSLGLSRERLIFDPGVGFGKNVAQNLRILERAADFVELGLPILIGHSRKSFLSGLPNLSPTRDPETLALSLPLAQKCVDYLRVHDVALHRAAFEAISQ